MMHFILGEFSAREKRQIWLVSRTWYDCASKDIYFSMMEDFVDYASFCRSSYMVSWAILIFVKEYLREKPEFFSES